MSKEVIISIEGKQNSGTEAADKTLFVTTGNYYEKNGKHYITYKETEITGFGSNTTTTVKVDGSVVTMMRFGDNNSQLVFEQGRKHIGYYETPFGGFTVGILSECVDVNMNEGVGDINIRYQVEINNTPQSLNDIHLRIREA